MLDLLVLGVSHERKTLQRVLLQGESVLALQARYMHCP